jgi:hypothetical protein
MISKKDIKPGKIIKSRELGVEYKVKQVIKRNISRKNSDIVVYCEPVKKYFYYTNTGGEKKKASIPGFKSKIDHLIKDFR